MDDGPIPGTAPNHCVSGIGQRVLAAAARNDPALARPGGLHGTAVGRRPSVAVPTLGQAREGVAR